MNLFFSLPLLVLLGIFSATGATAGCSDVSFPTYHSRKLLQASADASAVAIDNLAGQTTNQTASASAEAAAVASSIVPLPPTTQCIRFNNTNYSGFLLYFVYGIQSADACCDLCSNQQYCNVYVYCGKAGGCDDGSGRIYPGSLCTLKYQDLKEGTTASAYGAGPTVPWTSGIVTRTSLGYCIGYASAAASASATAGCDSIAYATAVATAVDSCGNEASASALAVAVGGKCPVTCEQSVESVKQAAAKNGCDSSQYKEAVNTASALCGTTKYAELASGICLAPSCEAAVASASATASAGCDSVAYASSLAVAQSACGSAFSSASATAIGGRCPTTCDAAVAAAVSASTTSGCNSTEFLSAQSTAIVVCGAQSYSAAAAAAVPGGICTIGSEKVTRDVPPPAVEEGSGIPGPLPINLAPTIEGGGIIGGVSLPEVPADLFPVEPSQPRAPTAEETAPVVMLAPAPEMEGQQQISIVEPELIEPEIVVSLPPTTEQQQEQQQPISTPNTEESSNVVVETPPPTAIPPPPPATEESGTTETTISSPQSAPPAMENSSPPTSSSSQASPPVVESPPPPPPAAQVASPPPPTTEQSPPPPPPPLSAPVPQSEQSGSSK